MNQITERHAHQAAFLLSLACALAGMGVGLGLGSATVLNDAAHMLADSTGFFIVLMGFLLSESKATSKYTYGLYKVEALGTLLSVDLLWIVTGIVIYVSGQRIAEINTGEFERLDGWPILGMGIASLITNLAILAVLSNVSDHAHSHHQHGHSHGDDDHPAQEFTVEGGMATVSIRTTEDGSEKMFITPVQINMWANVKVKIHREDGRGIETLTFFKQQDSTWRSEQVPEEPHEFRAELVIKSGGAGEPTIEESFGFNMVEPEVTWSQSFRNSFAHVIGHVIQCTTVIVVGIVLIAVTDNPHVQLIDPVVAIISALISVGLTVPVTIDAVQVLLDSAPERIPVEKVVNAILAIEGVQSVHDLHLWRLKSGKNCLTAHVNIDRNRVEQVSLLLDQLHRTTFHMGIEHATFQLEVDEGEGGSDHHREHKACGISADSLLTNGGPAEEGRRVGVSSAIEFV